MSRTEKSDSNNNLVGSANNSGAKQYSVYQQLADPVLSSKKTLQTMDHIGEIVMTNCKRSQVDSRMSALVSFNSLGNGSDSKQSK